MVYSRGELVRVYTLLSHDGRLLPIQIAALRAYIRDLSKIIVVQGPCGRNPLTSSGGIRVSSQSASRSDLELLEAPDDLAGLPPVFRMQALLKWLWEQHLPRTPVEACLVIHGDLIPVRSLDKADLLGDCGIAGRTIERGPRWYVPGTWILSSTNSIGELRWETERGWMNGRAMCGWAARQLCAADIPEISYQEHLRWEWCEPGWIHVDKLKMVGASPFLNGLFEEKVIALNDWCTARRLVPAPIVYEEMTELPFHRTRMPRPIVNVRPAELPVRQPDIPLAGDVVEAIAQRVGANRLARLWEKWTGIPCGCRERKEKLNKATERLLHWWNSKNERKSS